MVEPVLPTKMPKQTSSNWKSSLLRTLAGASVVALSYRQITSYLTPDFHQEVKAPVCVNPPKIVPQLDGFYDISHFRTPEYKNHSLAVWSGAVRIPTETYDDAGDVNEDPRFKVFYKFEDYLLKTFPRVAAAFNLDHVNVHGLVFTYEGTNKSLRPLMMTAHQDVVPVPDNTVSRWKYPPFEAHFDGRYLWGRGSSDCKNNLIGILEALEALLEKGFVPKRTIILAFGYDEEHGGVKGAAKIGEWLENKYGKNGIFMLQDEGGMGVQDIEGTRYALPSTGEKGYFDAYVDLITTGGHSSVPPRNTAIGIMAQIIADLELNHPSLQVTPKSPYYQQLMCEAQFSTQMDESLRSDILAMDSDTEAEARVMAYLDKNMITKAMAGTTQAIDVLMGGLKINSLPEKVTLEINYRIAYEDTIEQVKEHLYETVAKYAKKYGLGVYNFGENATDEITANEFDEWPIGNFFLSSPNSLAPTVATNTTNNPSWDLLAGTLRNVFEDFAVYPGADPSVGKTVVVSPSVMTGNTDVRHYTQLSENLYRYTPVRHFARKYAHAINEHTELDAHLEGVAFYHQLFRNVDASDAI